MSSTSAHCGGPTCPSTQHLQWRPRYAGPENRKSSHGSQPDRTVTRTGSENWLSQNIEALYFGYISGPQGSRTVIRIRTVGTFVHIFCAELCTSRSSKKTLISTHSMRNARRFPRMTVTVHILTRRFAGSDLGAPRKRICVRAQRIGSTTAASTRWVYRRALGLRPSHLCSRNRHPEITLSCTHCAKFRSAK